MLLFSKRLLLLLLPVLVSEIAAPPEPIPISVVVVALPVTLQFLTILLLAPDPNHTTALDVPVLVLVMVISWLDVVPVQIELVTGFSDPSMIMYLALVPNIITPVVLEAVITGDTPVFGRIVSVLTALASAFVPNETGVADRL